LQVERSFLLLKELLLQHSVQRPPYSAGLLSLAEMHRCLEWLLDTYYRHYKLYQFVFTCRHVRPTVQRDAPLSLPLGPAFPPNRAAGSA
jgi:hypothetical protein